MLPSHSRPSVTTMNRCIQTAADDSEKKEETNFGIMTFYIIWLLSKNVLLKMELDQ